MPILQFSDVERRDTLRDAIESDVREFFSHSFFQNLQIATEPRIRDLINHWQKNPNTIPFQRIGERIVFLDTQENRQQLVGVLVMILIERREREHAEADQIFCRAKAEYTALIWLKRTLPASGQGAYDSRINELSATMRNCHGRLSEERANTLQAIVLNDGFHSQMWVHALSDPHTYPTLPSGKIYDTTILGGIFDTANQGLRAAQSFSAELSTDCMSWTWSLEFVVNRAPWTDHLSFRIAESVHDYLWGLRGGPEHLAKIQAYLKTRQARGQRAKVLQEREETARLSGIANEAKVFVKSRKDHSPWKKLDVSEQMKLLEIKCHEEPFYRIVRDLAIWIIVSTSSKRGSGNTDILANEETVGLVIKLVMRAVGWWFLKKYNLPAKIITLPWYDPNKFREHFFGGAVQVNSPSLRDLAKALHTGKIYRSMMSYCRNELWINPDNISSQHQTLLSLWLIVDPNADISTELREVVACAFDDPQFHMVLRFFRESEYCKTQQRDFPRDENRGSAYMQACALELMWYGYAKVRELMQQEELPHVVDVWIWNEINQIEAGREEVERFFDERVYAHPSFTVFGNLATFFWETKTIWEALQLFARRFILTPIPPVLERDTLRVGAMLHRYIPRILENGIHWFINQLKDRIGLERFRQMELVEIMMVAIELAESYVGSEPEEAGFDDLLLLEGGDEE